MNDQHTTSAVKPRQEINPSNDDKFKIHLWCGKYEGYLFHNASPAAYERYGRALSKFIGYFPQNRYTYEFLRADFEDYKQIRLKEGANPTTVNIELSILRGFWRWMLRMEAPGVMMNPVIGVRVQTGSNDRKPLDQAPRGTPTTSPQDCVLLASTS